MTTLSRDERNALPDAAFGLPEQRAYPMPDRRHARNAKARASAAFDRGHLSWAQKCWIDRKADALLAGG